MTAGERVPKVWQNLRRIRPTCYSSPGLPGAPKSAVSRSTAHLLSYVWQKRAPMSEYQYYEFHALDQPLSDKAQDDIRSLSRRVTLTPTHAIFVYNYGDFPADPLEILQKHFDAMLYLSNLGCPATGLSLPTRPGGCGSPGAVLCPRT